MNVMTVFVVGLIATVAIGVGAVAYLRRPLEKMLVELCGNQERAGFWTAFSAVALAVMPVIFAIGWRPSAESRLPMIFDLADQLKWALIGLLGTLLVLGWLIWTSIARWESRQAARKNEPQRDQRSTEGL